MSRTFSCTFLTDAHKLDTERYAREYKHMTLSEFARFAMNEYIKKYAYKGRQEVEGKLSRPSPADAMAVQPEPIQGKSTPGAE